MRNTTHEAVGAAVTLTVCAAVDSGRLAAAAAVCASLLGWRLPDAADQPGHGSTAAHDWSVAVSSWGSPVEPCAYRMSAFARSAQHRGATHWLLSAAAATIILAGAPGALWPPLVLPVATGVGCGYCAHLLADACTPRGAPLLGPFSARRVHLLTPFCRVPTGSAGDLLVLIAAIITATALSLLVLQST